MSVRNKLLPYKEEVIAMFKNGKRPKEIAEKYGVSNNIVWWSLDKWGYNRGVGKGEKNAHWKGCGGFSYTAYRDILSHAKERGLEVNVTVEDIWKQFLAQGGKCALSGVDLVLEHNKHRTTDSRNKSTTASLDRIDSKRGYEIDNIQFVHKDLNSMKWSLEQDYFIELCTIIAQRMESGSIKLPDGKIVTLE